MKWQIWLMLVAMALGFLGFGALERGDKWTQQSLKEVTVCPNGPPECDFASIQEAVEAVAEGGRVAIHAGEYVENVIIRKPLTLAGNGSLKLGEGSVLRSKDPQKASIQIISSNVEVSGLIFLEPSGILVGELETEDFKPPTPLREILIHKNLFLGREAVGVGVLWAEDTIIEENLFFGEAIFMYAIGSRNLLISGNIGRGMWIDVYGGTVEIYDNEVGHLWAAGLWRHFRQHRPEELPTLDFHLRIEHNIVIHDIVILSSERDRLEGFIWLSDNDIGGVIYVEGRRVSLDKNRVMTVPFDEPEGISDWWEKAGIFAVAKEELDVSENLVADSVSHGLLVGVEEGGELWLSRNWVLRSEGFGIVLLHRNRYCYCDEDGGRWDLDKLAPAVIEGYGNVLLGNKEGDLCPVDFPWPEEFKR